MDELEASIVRLLHLEVLAWRSDENARGWPLSLASFSDLSPTLHVDVGDVFVFAEDGKVGKHIDRRDVSGNHDETAKNEK